MCVLLTFKETDRKIYPVSLHSTCICSGIIHVPLTSIQVKPSIIYFINVDTIVTVGLWGWFDQWVGNCAFCTVFLKVVLVIGVSLTQPNLDARLAPDSPSRILFFKPAERPLKSEVVLFVVLDWQMWSGEIFLSVLKSLKAFTKAIRVANLAWRLNLSPYFSHSRFDLDGAGPLGCRATRQWRQVWGRVGKSPMSSP